MITWSSDKTDRTITRSKGDLREVSEGVAGGVGQSRRPRDQVVSQPRHHLDISRANISEYNRPQLSSLTILGPAYLASSGPVK